MPLRGGIMAKTAKSGPFRDHKNADNDLLELHEKGMSQQEIATELADAYSDDRFTKSAIRKASQRLNVEFGTKPGPDKQTYQEKAEKADINTLLAKKSLYDHIGESFVEAIKRLPDPTHPEEVRTNDHFDEEEMFIVFSDSQIGSLVNPKETGGLGSYSTEEFLARLDFFKEKLAKIFEIERSVVPYRRINVFFLGDIIEGATIFRGQLRSIDKNVVQQVMVSVNALSDFISWLSTLFAEVGCYCVVGNHGRIGLKGELSPMDNLDYLTYKWVEERTADITNVEVNVADTWWMAVERMRHRFVLVHGDDVKAWMNIPFYGADRSEGRMQRLLGIGFQYFVIGHHHTPAEFGNVIMNGNWVGGSEFSLKVIQAGGLPSQKLFSVHRAFGITWSRDVKLVDPRTLKPTKIYS